MKKIALLVALAISAGSLSAVPLLHKHHKTSKKDHKKAAPKK